MAVQYHEKGGKIFLISGQTGMLMVADSISAWDGRSEYGPFQEPFKAIWSKHHSGVIIVCKYGVHIVTLPSGEKTLIQGLVSNEVSDVSERDGIVAILSKSTDENTGLVKILSDDLTKNKLLLQTTGEFPSKICLTSEGKAIIAFETLIEGAKKTRFAIANLNTATVASFTDYFDGVIVSLFHDGNFNIAFAVFSDGKIVMARIDGTLLTVSLAGNVSEDIIVAKGELIADILSSNFQQKLVRVFVGSRQGANDRWDSGVITTSETEMLYGGGNNLEPGNRYWVTILVQDEALGWSAPFSKEFVAPLSYE
jgi:hypothetical protein